ncbi:glycosyl hydrolase family 65 protein [Paenibacillus sp. MMS20-IR301]|uniref:glycoside hydrolase family 65 protein n=1 Tax=Paenibacillus sp. MMS20-IR301 TaxID=2895946 RepID=UPI0028EAF099|nr:glycosyl hydrolase family 65 protein [Paenibacillus sp. MMS20-IR301]WNS44047.1 glycosyl hydrolase family 65 protein [Paenibacillus sp. MMS20-IR301]
MNENNLWCLKEDGYQASLHKHYEGLFTQGNGYMHIRGSFEEGCSDAPQDEEYLRFPDNVTLEKPRHLKSKQGTYIPGIVAQHPLLKEEIVNLPYILGFEFQAAGGRLDMDRSRISGYSRWLDLRDGSLHRSFIWETAEGMQLKCTFGRYLSMADTHLCIQEVQLEVLAGGGRLEVAAALRADVRTNGMNHFAQIIPAAQAEGSLSLETLTAGGNQIIMLSALEASRAVVWHEENTPERAALRGEFVLAAGDRLTLSKLTAVTTDRDMEEGGAGSRAQAQLKLARELGREQLYERHAAGWKRKWQAADMVIKGDDHAQLSVRASLYHLIRANAEQDARVAICAKGYAGEAYFGRYFWDTEINLLPFFLHTNPQAARNLVLFRYHTLDGARRNAQQYGYRGARYAWESSLGGEEQCANWQYADHEVHITADVVYALYHYVRATGDEEFLGQYGIDILVETARYWCDRVDWNKEGFCELLGVMGPDEYLPLTRNNAFTNRMVKFSLEQTASCLDSLQENQPERYAAAAERLNIGTEERELFLHTAEKLRLPYDSGTDIVPQSDDFAQYADLDFDRIWTDRSRPFGHFISQERNYRSKALKQADVLELMLLFPQEFSGEQLKAAYEYYEPLTTHDSSLSVAVHGIIASWLDRKETAAAFLQRVMAIDLSAEKKGAAEGIHIANCGGLWQLIVYGFAGLGSAMWTGEIQLAPRLPAGWEELSFPLAWRGERYRITVHPDSYEVCKLNGGDDAANTTL